MGWTGGVPISRDGLIDLQELPHADANKAARSNALIAVTGIGKNVFHPIGLGNFANAPNAALLR